MKHIELLNDDVSYLETGTARSCCNTCNGDVTCGTCNGCESNVCGTDLCPNQEMCDCDASCNSCEFVLPCLLNIPAPCLLEDVYASIIG
jgi:hypothetical protein